MKVSDYIVDFLIHNGITDVFGLPGGVILDFLYALDKRTDEIMAHLNYHEQGAAFAACGYAQVAGRLGVAYATRGPGITNMLTGIADAYYDSIPVLFITAHAYTGNRSGMRIDMDQEMDSLCILSGITKYSARVNHAQDVRYELEYACHLALTGRKGPVVLDFSSHIFSEDINSTELQLFKFHIDERNNIAQIIECLTSSLKKAKRPVLLIGDGIRQSDTVSLVTQIAEKAQLPVLSSRFSQDIMPMSPLYYGYIGSHATRYSNFILSKADLIIALGNRMSFPVNSASFSPIIRNAKIIRIDVDAMEFFRRIPNSIEFLADLKELLPQLMHTDFIYEEKLKWLSICNDIKKILYDYDINYPINSIAAIFNTINNDAIITSDVGNNEFWLSRAYTYAGVSNRILYSKSFGAMGCSLAKAIGAHFSTKKNVVCFTGDQGFQLNIQELQFVSHFKLPIAIVILNNSSSGMIRSREKLRYDHFVHTTLNTGYSVPDFEAIANAYKLIYYRLSPTNFHSIFEHIFSPCIIELQINESIDLAPWLPRGNACQNLNPPLNKELYEQLNTL